MTGNGNGPVPGPKMADFGSGAEPCAGHPPGTGHPQSVGQPLAVNPAAAGTAAH